MAVLSHLKSRIAEFAEVHLIDVTDENAVEMPALENGRILFEHPQTEAWVKNTLYLIKLLQDIFGG